MNLTNVSNPFSAGLSGAWYEWLLVGINTPILLVYIFIIFESIVLLIYEFKIKCHVNKTLILIYSIIMSMIVFMDVFFIIMIQISNNILYGLFNGMAQSLIIALMFIFEDITLLSWTNAFYNLYSEKIYFHMKNYLIFNIILKNFIYVPFIIAIWIVIIISQACLIDYLYLFWIHGIIFIIAASLTILDSILVSISSCIFFRHLDRASYKPLIVKFIITLIILIIVTIILTALISIMAFSKLMPQSLPFLISNSIQFISNGILSICLLMLLNYTFAIKKK